MKLNVNEKEYKVEFSFEAMYNSEFIKEMFETMNSLDNVENEITVLSEMPKKVTNMLLVGLQENHSDEFKNVSDVKALIKDYFKENTDNPEATMLGLYTKLIETMDEDGFLAQIGLVEKKKQVKTPQDHKKKTTTQSKK